MIQTYFVQISEKKRNLNTKLQAITHAYVHWLADVHSGSFAPAFTLSFHDSECSRKPPMPIASVVRAYSKKGKRRTRLLKNLWRTVRFYDINRRVLLSRICAFSCICLADNSSQILKERIGLSTFRLQTIATEIESIAVWQNKKTNCYWFKVSLLASGQKSVFGGSTRKET